jgi:hypothetical protein
MNTYKIIAVVLLAVIVASIYDLGPAIQQLAYTVAELPKLDSSRSSEPAVFSLAVRAMYLIAIVGIIKLLVMGKRDK